MQTSQLEVLLLLRVAATVLVVLGHAGSIFAGVDFLRAPVTMNVQSAAVTVFFCISGWTIAWVVDRVPRYDTFHLVRFVFDRFFRLAIPLVPALVFFAAIEWWILGDSHPYPGNIGLGDLTGNMLFLQGLSIPFLDTIPPFGLNRPLWTISIEFWIYVFFGALVFILRGRQYFLAGLLCLLGLALIKPFIWGGRGDGLVLVWMFGACAYALRDRIRPSFAMLMFGVSLICLFVPALWPENGNYSKTFNLVLAVFVSSCVIAIFNMNFKISKPIRYVSKYCYTVYLTHYPVLILVDIAWPDARGSAVALAATLAAFVFGWLASHAGERHYKKVRATVWSWLSGCASDASSCQRPTEN